MAHKMLKDETCETVRSQSGAAERFPVWQGHKISVSVFCVYCMIIRFASLL